MRWLRAQELAVADQNSKDRVNEQLARFRKAMKWIDDHRAEYIGQWVALHGDRLISNGPNARLVHDQAKAAGIKIPFVVRVVEEDGPFVAGW